MKKDIHSYYLQQLKIPHWQMRTSAPSSTVLDSQIPSYAKLIFIAQSENLLSDKFKLFLIEIGNALQYGNSEIGYIFFSNASEENINHYELVKRGNSADAITIFLGYSSLSKFPIQTQSSVFSILIDDDFDWQSIHGKKFLMQKLIEHGFHL